MMKVTNVHILRRNKSKSLTINLHHVLSTVMMDNPAVFTNFLRNTVGFTTQKTINVIANFIKYFGYLLAVNDGDIDTFVKDNHSVNNARADAQRILISNSITQGLKSKFFDLKDRELCNDELALHGINADQLSIMRNNRTDSK